MKKGNFNSLLTFLIFIIILILTLFFNLNIINNNNNDINNTLINKQLQQQQQQQQQIEQEEQVNIIKKDEISKDNQIEYAYITLLHGIDNSFKYRGYLYNIMIMKEALKSYGSKADFIVMIGYTTDKNNDIFQTDLNRLTSIGIKLIILPRYLNTEKVNFAEMALLKITPWSLTNYKRIQFLDGDVMPTMNMDCYFQLNFNTFNVGNASPLNSGWFIAIPNQNDYENLKQKALKRLNEPWNKVTGWGEQIPSWLTNSRGKNFPDWNFNGASLDQGLLTHYFVIHTGKVVLVNGNVITQYNGENQPSQRLNNDYLNCCQKRQSVLSFVHFTGKSKPWLNPVKGSTKKYVLLWGKYLDDLHLEVNSTNIHEQGLKPPLGYFHPNT